MWSPVLTISRLSRWSINYYNDTARQATRVSLDRRRANGGLGEHYSEGGTRAPTWLIAGDAARTVELVGLDGRAANGGTADPDLAARWLDDGITPNGAAGRGFTKGSVHGFDLTLAAPKSVSAAAGLDRRHRRQSNAGRPSAGHHRRDDLSAPARRVHPSAQAAHRREGLAAATRAGGHRLPARNLTLRRPAPAHPRPPAQPASPRRRRAGVDRLQVAVSRSQIRRHRLSSRPAPRAAHRARRGTDVGGPVFGDGRDRRRHQKRIKAWSRRSSRLRDWARSSWPPRKKPASRGGA
jgi:TrwC relaxase